MASLPSEPDQEGSEPLKYKTWVLKVSIHCEGCKRKVKRILHSVEGVYTIDVDTRQHKVIVTGNVDANTLIRKLEKSGKHAELWPNFQQAPQKIDEQINQEQQQQQQENQNQNQNQAQPQNQIPNVEQHQQGPENSGQQQPQQVKEVRFEENNPSAGDPQKPPANNAGNGGGDGGSKKKKKKKKANTANNGNANPNNNGGNVNAAGNPGVVQGGDNGPPPTDSNPPPPAPPQNPNPSPPVNMSTPSQPQNCRVYEHPPTYYAPPPVYAVSYNTAYPSSYSASYYSAPPPYSYAYVHQGADVEAVPAFNWNPHAAPPSDSFEIFSDENPNACSVM
ncbi:heavy metal-associated isoprenylated plant protein 35-like [Amaranthus tricolor]|uniref:heavy metal-associated isoprenylated plant protein 35-like n=1 Tax=Amaranthus tricolor TaxID=29722 RepID=UPI002586A4E8|nr:heavy metal-associated isoprenylated plant protein 35-like [Amaranthus tricolor]